MSPALDVKSCVFASLAQRGWTQVQVMKPGAKTSGKGVLYEKGNTWPTKAAETIPRKATSVPCWTRTRGRHTTDGFRAGAVKPVLAPVALSQGQQPLRFPSPLHSVSSGRQPAARSQEIPSRPPDLLSHPLKKVLLCSEHGHCVFLSTLKIFQSRKLGDVESFCQGLVDSGIDSCKDTRALGWGRGQPCMTASDTVLAKQRSPDDSPRPTLDLLGFHWGLGGGWAWAHTS